MADFVAVLRKTIGALEKNSPETRERVFDKARATIDKKLAAIDPPPPQIVVDRQRKALEDAIATVRAEYDQPAEDSFEDLVDAFNQLDDQPAKLEQEGPSSRIADPAEPEKEEDVSAVAAAPFTPADDASSRQPDEDRESAIDPADPAFAAGPLDPANTDEAPVSDMPPAGRAANAERTRAPRRRRTGLLAAVSALLLIVGAAGYALWLNSDGFTELMASTGLIQASETDEPEPAVEAETVVEETDPGEETAAEGEPEKFTQRLLPDGTEVDEGPAGEERRIGEGTSIAAASGPAGEAVSEPAGTAETGTGQARPAEQVTVGQRAIFYEQSTSSDEGSAETGSIVWRLVQESPGGDAPPEPAIRAEATIPAHNLQLRMTIRRNADQTLPASHIVEMIFLTPENFAGGAIDSVLRITMKETEEETGRPLQGIPAKIADGFFLIALSDVAAETEANLALMRDQNWIDIPVVYRSGRRALMTMEKGIPGERVFEEAMQAWREATSG